MHLHMSRDIALGCVGLKNNIEQQCHQALTELLHVWGTLEHRAVGHIHLKESLPWPVANMVESDEPSTLLSAVVRGWSVQVSGLRSLRSESSRKQDMGGNPRLEDSSTEGSTWACAGTIATNY